MSVKIREKNGYLYLDIYCNGRRKWEALHLTVSSDRRQNREVMRLAEICRSKRELQVVSGEWGLSDPCGGKKNFYLYLSELKGNVSKNSVLKVLERYPGGSSIQIGQINEKWLNDFQEYLLNDCNLSGSTPHIYEKTIRIALKKAERERIIASNPAVRVKAIKKTESNRVFLNVDEIQKMAAYPVNTDLYADVKKAFLFSCCTGLRISDLRTLTWENIEHNPPQIIKNQKKTGRKVFIPLNETAWKIINDGSMHSCAEAVFPLVSSSTWTMNEYLMRWAQRAGVQKQIGWHTARHTFAVLSLESGADIYTVSRLLGHTDVQTTQIYAKATDKMKREAVNALPQIEIRDKG